MKKMRKLMSLFLAFALVLGFTAPLGALASQPAEQTPTDITVNVHKILMSKADLDKHDVNKEYRPDKGIENIKTFFGESATEIEGVYFVALKEGHDNYDNFESLTKDQQKAVVDGVAATMKGLTGANGQLALTLQSPGKYKIYEVKSLSTYNGATAADKRMLAEKKAVPVVLDLPNHARTEDGIATEIHVYPKNTDDKPSVDKKVVKDGQDVKEASFDKDEEHTWAIEATIPTGFKDYEVFELTDVLEKALTYKQGQTVSVKVKDNKTITLEENTDYTVTAPKETEGGTLKVALTKAGITKLAAVEGSILRVEFVTTINDNAVMSKNIPNTVTLKYGHNPDSAGTTKPGDNPRVYTGGKKFVKIDSDKKDLKLKGAQFVIKDDKGKYLVEKDGKYSWKDVKSTKAADLVKDKDLKVITSGENGTFEIKGLEYVRPDGTKYFLQEIKAPEKYALLDKEIPFTVNDTSYYKDATAIDLVDADPQKVDNKKITIPQTGGMGTIAFILVGLALMAGAFVAIRRRSV